MWPFIPTSWLELPYYFFFWVDKWNFMQSECKDFGLTNSLKLKKKLSLAAWAKSSDVNRIPGPLDYLLAGVEGVWGMLAGDKTRHCGEKCLARHGPRQWGWGGGGGILLLAATVTVAHKRHAPL